MDTYNIINQNQKQDTGEIKLIRQSEVDYPNILTTIINTNSLTIPTKR
jgi:hypothetical protein